MNQLASWADRQVVVCGGTSGLGLQLVNSAAKRNAHLVILGRDPGRLQSAQQMALDQGARTAKCFSLDMRQTDPTPTENGKAFQDWLAQHNVDLLINAVGRSDRGALELLNSSEIEAMFHDNVICTWNTIRCCLDSLKRAQGTIVNIGSLAGLVSAPGMGGYCIAKSALTAMTRQLRLELTRDQVHVMLVCPGPIQRSDSGSRYQELAN
jgi:uncharacterized protein